MPSFSWLQTAAFGQMAGFIPEGVDLVSDPSVLLPTDLDPVVLSDAEMSALVIQLLSARPYHWARHCGGAAADDLGGGYGNGRAAAIKPTQDPKPIDAKPSRSQRPRKITSSPWRKKDQLSPFGSAIGRAPAFVSSSILPSSSVVGPEIVPVPSRSPACKLQPLTV